jgi:sugar phosphate isomerase/epimerase
MQLGCCASLADIDKVAGAGFEYIECGVSTMKPEEDDAAFAPVLAALRSASIPIRACNNFIPGDLKVTGPNVDQARLVRYATKAIERMHAVGVRVVVFGSGGARNIPDGFPRERGIEQFVAFAHTVGEIAQKNGLMVGIEAINRGEKTNMINTLTDAVDIAQRVNHPSVKIIADVYHMALEHEPNRHILDYKDWIVHVHLADAPGRLAPGRESLPWAEAFDYLHQAGYDGVMSYECRWQDLAKEGPESIAFVRRVWAR